MKKVMPKDFIKAKREGRKLAVVTAYTHYQARVADEAGVDGILVGDSLGMVIMGYESTLPVTMEEVMHHLRAVLSASPRALVIADMPFLSYEVSVAEAVRNAGSLIKAGAGAVKVEGGEEVVDVVEELVRAGIPVMGHVGLNPQRYLVRGGYRLAGKTASDAERVLRDALALEDAGAFSVVVEFTAAEVAKKVTEVLQIPTICIGSGPFCDGQVTVFHDILGINPEPPPFVKQFARTRELWLEALRAYVREVREGLFPGEGMYWGMRSDRDREEFENVVSNLVKMRRDRRASP